MLNLTDWGVSAAAVARGGVQSMKPYMQQLYSSRAMLYRDALREFLKGYREGLSNPPDEPEAPTEQVQDREAASATGGEQFSPPHRSQRQPVEPAPTAAAEAKERG